MPHRDPLLAALLRYEDLRERVAEIDPPRVARRPVPVTLAQVVAEIAWLESELTKPRPPAGEVEPELGGLVCEGDRADLGELAPLPDEILGVRKPRSWVAIGLGLVAAAATLAAGFTLARAKPSAGATVPSGEMRVYLSGTVVSAAGPHVTTGDRCEITIVDSGERDVGRFCTIQVRCPRMTQHYPAESCPIAGGPIRFNTGSATFDVPAQRATFLFQNSWDVPEGGATLKLDNPR